MDKTSFLANVEQEGRIDQLVRTDEAEKETPPESPAEKKPTEDEKASPAKESDKPKEGAEGEDESEKGEPVVFQAFHKHPKWQAMNSELKELRGFVEKVQPLLDQIGKQPPKHEETPDVPEWFIELFGDNQAAWKKYRAYDSEQRKQLRADIVDEITRESQKAIKESQKWDEWVDNEFTELLEDTDIQAQVKDLGFDLKNKDQAKNFRNELFKVATDYQPADKDNNISLRKSFEILQLIKTKKSVEKPVDKKKEVADKTMAKGKPNEDRKDYKTSHDLAGKSFRDLATID